MDPLGHAQIFELHGLAELLSHWEITRRRQALVARDAVRSGLHQEIAGLLELPEGEPVTHVLDLCGQRSREHDETLIAALGMLLDGGRCLGELIEGLLDVRPPGRIGPDLRIEGERKQLLDRRVRGMHAAAERARVLLLRTGR